jgi:hypothetical protein
LKDIPIDFNKDDGIKDTLIELIKERHFNSEEAQRGFSEIHMSDLTKCITRVFYDRNNPRAFADGLDDNGVVRVALGLAWEQFLAGTVSHMTGDRFEVEGVLFNIDLELSELSIELKTTAMYINKDGEPQAPKAVGGGTKWPVEWKRRIMGYMYATSKQSFGLAIMQTMSRSLHGTFAASSLNNITEFWQEFFIPRRDALMEAFVEKKPPQPFGYNDNYECERCPYQMYCQALSGDETVTLPRTQHLDYQYLERADPKELLGEVR